MTRTLKTLRVLCLLITVQVLLANEQSAAQRPVLDKPNVILFFLDDSGYGDFSFNGNPTIHTPAIDELARQGVCFTQFYVGTAACSASRYSLLTGRYAARSGLGSWVIGPGAARHLHTDEITIAEALKNVGYRTGMFGKWHLGNPNAKNGMTADALPLAHGFDVWVGTNVSHDYGNAKLLKSDPKGNNPIPGYSEIAANLPSNAKASTSLTGRYTKAVVEFIKASKDKPFFAYVAHNQPHLGLYASDKFKGKSRRGLLGDVMAEVDHSIAAVMTALKETGIDKNTLIIFSSDNGPWLRFLDTLPSRKYGEARLHVGYAYPFRDGKGCASWEGGFRVPGIFYWPGVIAPKRQLEPASSLDVLPTVLRICGAKVPDDRSIDGRDVRALLSPKLSTAEVPPFNFVYSYSDNKSSALRMGAWKLHVRLGSQLRDNYGFTASRKSPLLFQVEEDLHERINRAAEHPEQARKMLRALAEHDAKVEQEGTYWDRPPALDVRMMTFNIRNGRAKDGDNDWAHRKAFVADVIRNYSPDVLGLQEAFRFQLDELNRRLPGYGEIGIGRDGGKRGEYSAILYRKDRFSVDESGTFWLSDTPTKPSAHWGNRYRRVCTWARLIEKSSSRPLYVYNTHMDHQSQRARENGARLIIKSIVARKHSDPFVLMGDFNAGEDNAVVSYLTGAAKGDQASPLRLIDSFRMLYPDETLVGTGSRFNGYTLGAKIDYIFVSPKTRTLAAAIVRTNRDGRYPSDHYPVTARLRFVTK